MQSKHTQACARTTLHLSRETDAGARRSSLSLTFKSQQHKNRQHALPWTQASGRARSLPPCQRKSARVSVPFPPQSTTQRADLQTHNGSTHVCLCVCVCVQCQQTPPSNPMWPDVIFFFPLPFRPTDRPVPLLLFSSQLPCVSLPQSPRYFLFTQHQAEPSPAC